MLRMLRADMQRNNGFITKATLFTYRFGNWLYYDFKVPLLRQIFWLGYKVLKFFFQNVLNSCEIPAQVKIGPGLRIVHEGRGIVIHPKCVLGDNVTILHGVTIGTTFTDSEHGIPTIGNNVLIGTGAKILGKLIIGDNVIVGANAVVTKDIHSNCTAVGIPAKVIPKKVKAIDF